MNVEIMQRLARHLGISLAEAFELEDKNVELFDFFETEFESMQENINREVIATLRDEAYKEGYDDGFGGGESEGWDAGYEAGLQEGFDKGYEEAKEE